MWWNDSSSRWDIVSKCMDSMKPAESAGVAAMYVHGVGRDVMKHLASMPGVKPSDVLPSLSHVDFSDLIVEFGKAIGSDAAVETIVGWHWDAARGADDVAKRLTAHGVSVPVALARAGDVYGVPPEEDSQFVSVAKAATNEEQVRRAGLTFVSRWASRLSADEVIAKAAADRFLRNNEYVDVRRDESGQFASKPKAAEASLFAEKKKDAEPGFSLFGRKEEDQQELNLFQQQATESQVGLFGDMPSSPTDVEGRQRMKAKRKKRKDDALRALQEAAAKKRESLRLEAELRTEQEAFDGSEEKKPQGVPPWEVDAKTKMKRLERLKRLTGVGKLKLKYEKLKGISARIKQNRKKIAARLDEQLNEARERRLEGLSPGEKYQFANGYFLSDDDYETLDYDYAVYVTGWQPDPTFSGSWDQATVSGFRLGQDDTAHWASPKNTDTMAAEIEGLPSRRNVYADEPVAAWKLAIPLWVAIPAFYQNDVAANNGSAISVNMGRINSALIEAGDKPVAVTPISERQAKMSSDDPEYADSLAPLTNRDGQWYINVFVPPYSRAWDKPFNVTQSMSDYVAPMRSFTVQNTAEGGKVDAVAPTVSIDVTGPNRFIESLKTVMDEAYFRKTNNLHREESPTVALDRYSASIMANADMDEGDGQDYQARIDPDKGVIGSQRVGVRGLWVQTRGDLNNAIEDGWNALTDYSGRDKNWHSFQAAVQQQERLKVQRWLENTWAEEFYQGYFKSLDSKREDQRLIAGLLGANSAQEYFGIGSQPLLWEAEPGVQDPFTLSALFKSIHYGSNPFLEKSNPSSAITTRSDPEEVRDIYLQRAANLLTFTDPYSYEPVTPAVLNPLDEVHSFPISASSPNYLEFKRSLRQEADPFHRGRIAQVGDTIVARSEGGSAIEAIWVWEYPIATVRHLHGHDQRTDPATAEWVHYGAPDTGLEVYEATRALINQVYSALQSENPHARRVSEETRSDMLQAERTFRGVLMDMFASAWDPKTFPRHGHYDADAWDDKIDEFIVDLLYKDQDQVWAAATPSPDSDLPDNEAVDGQLMFLWHSHTSDMDDANLWFDADMLVDTNVGQEELAHAHIPTLAKRIDKIDSLLRRDIVENDYGVASERPMQALPQNRSDIFGGYKDIGDMGLLNNIDFQDYASLVGLMNKAV